MVIYQATTETPPLCASPPPPRNASILIGTQYSSCWYISTVTVQMVAAALCQSTGMASYSWRSVSFISSGNISAMSLPPRGRCKYRVCRKTKSNSYHRKYEALNVLQNAQRVGLMSLLLQVIVQPLVCWQIAGDSQ